MTAAVEREVATRKILAVISQSRDNEAAVFDAILENAARLCRAPIAFLSLVNDVRSEVTVPAHRGTRSEFGSILDGFVEPITRTELVAARPIADGEVARQTDIKDDDADRSGDPRRLQMVDVEGARSVLAVPLISDGQPIGAIVLYRREVQAFDNDDEALVQSFAAQAVLAIENVRQFRALQTRLASADANREILELIRTNRDDEQPVFETIVRNAVELCGAKFCMLWRYDGTQIHYCASHGFTDAFMADYLQSYPMKPDPAGVAYKVLEAGCTAHLPNAQADSFVDAGVACQHGYDYMLGVPVETAEGIWGVMVLAWPKGSQPPSEQVELLETFAAPAVIAIDNVRQFRELQTRLEREAAKREILSVISQSRDDDAPVFNAILQKAAELCDAPHAWLILVNGERTHFKITANFGQDLQAMRLGEEFDLNSPYKIAETLREGRTTEFVDLADTDQYRAREANYVRLVEEENHRTCINVPLFHEGAAIGCIVVNRHEIRRFAPDEVALLETFAAQAVIAIENARQFRELQTLLEREEASRQILDVISQSRDDDRPVFETIMENAARLCKAPHAGMLLRNAADTHLELLASNAASSAFTDVLRESPHALDNKGSLAVEAVRTTDMRHIHDLSLDGRSSLAPQVQAAIEAEGMKTILLVPLISGARAIGVSFLYKRVVEPFTEDEITLVRTFAAQAVIAIENANQLKALVAARDDAEAALADLKKAQERLVQPEKMVSLGQLTAGIAHEIKNPLNFVNNFAKLSEEMLEELAEILEDPMQALVGEHREDAEDLMQTVRENLGKINQHGSRADGIIKNMLLHSRDGPAERQRVARNPIAEEALDLACHGARAENSNFNIEMQTDFAADVGEIDFYPQDLMRVLLNLISNGMYAAHKRALEEEGHAPVISVTSRVVGDRYGVEVRDNGMGIPEEMRERIFTPFFTTKPAGEGTGLGLSLSYDIVVKQHGDDLIVDSRPSEFTAFVTSFPITLSANIGGAP